MKMLVPFFMVMNPMVQIRIRIIRKKNRRKYKQILEKERIIFQT